MKILHITYHNGCTMNINFIAQHLGYDITLQKADWNYNIGHQRAEELWNKYKDFYNQFDLIITSDTTPLSRIFLQNNFIGKLIIWVSNRFDYSDAASFDCEFPDQEYYDLIRSIPLRQNVKIFANTIFEYKYAQKYKNVNIGDRVIKPCAFAAPTDEPAVIPDNINKSNTFFLLAYHNETLFTNMKEKCDGFGIPTFNGRFGNYDELKAMKGIIHIPYAWSTFALFENLSMGIVYLIPSKEFLLKLLYQDNFFWQDAYGVRDGFLDISEWYLPEHKNLFAYFNSWEHLKQLTLENDTFYHNKKQQILVFSEQHIKNTITKWKEAIGVWR